MNVRSSSFGRSSRIPILRRATFALVTLIGLAWSSSAVCGEIHDAVREGNSSKVKALLKRNPKLVFSQDLPRGWTPLHWAAYEGDRPIAALLLTYHAAVNGKDLAGRTPLHLAAQNTGKGVAELLLANKAEVNAKNNFGDTPLHYAAITGRRDIAVLLLTHGADINAKDVFGRTPLYLALENGQKDMANFLLFLGAATSGQKAPTDKGPSSDESWGKSWDDLQSASTGELIGMWFFGISVTWLIILFANVGLLVACLLSVMALMAVGTMFSRSVVLGVLFSILTLANYYALWRTIQRRIQTD
jgi:Ankyrin repeats (3 copies)/Ankyrin repeat